MAMQMLAPIRSSRIVAIQHVNRPSVKVHASAIAPPAKLPHVALDGTIKGREELALKVADPTNANHVVHRYVVTVQQNARAGTASTLTRGEVRGGGRKPYPQKGTGHARRGSTRSPLIRGGGVIFGPKPRDWSIKMNRKERRLAIATALQSAARDCMVVDSLRGKLPDKKTKQLLALLAQLGVSVDRKPVLLILSKLHRGVFLAGRNVPNLVFNVAENVKCLDVLKADKILIEREALDIIRKKYGGEQQYGDDDEEEEEEQQQQHGGEEEGGEGSNDSEGGDEESSSGAESKNGEDEGGSKQA